MYALFAICNALSPSRLDDNILNIVKERYGEQVAKMAQGFVLFPPFSLIDLPNDLENREEGLSAFEELFLYACPKFISANPPPYHDASLLGPYLENPSPIVEQAQHQLALFMNDVRNQLAIPTLRSFLRLYTSLDAAKLAGFLDKEEEDVVREMMVMKQASRSVSRAAASDKEKEKDNSGGGGNVHHSNGSLLDGETISTSDLDFVINQVGCFFFILEFSI